MNHIGRQWHKLDRRLLCSASVTSTPELFAEYGICLPIAKLLPAIDDGGTFINRALVLDEGALADAPDRQVTLPVGITTSLSIKGGAMADNGLRSGGHWHACAKYADIWYRYPSANC